MAVSRGVAVCIVFREAEQGDGGQNDLEEQGHVFDEASHRDSTQVIRLCNTSVGGRGNGRGETMIRKPWICGQ